jgi:hypothetical protein
MLKNVTNTHRKAKGRTNATKYKTEMCRNWLELGTCHYGKKCNYAHGKNEMIDKILPNDNYKTKHCIPFNDKGFCTYGHRCLFVHNNGVSEAAKKKSYSVFLANPELKCKKPRLPIFQKITGDLVQPSLATDWVPTDFTEKELVKFV